MLPNHQTTLTIAGETSLPLVSDMQIALREYNERDGRRCRQSIGA